MNRYLLLFLVLGLVLIGSFWFLRAPAVTPDNNPNATSTGNNTANSANIVVDSPKPNDSVLHDFKIAGRARVFENQFAWRVLDPQGTVLASGSAYAYAPDAGQFGPFDIDVHLPVSATFGTDRVTVEVFDNSAKDGSVIDLVQIPVSLSDAPATTLKVYFNNSKLDPEVTCNKVFPVNRFILKTNTPARAAIDELLQGSTEAEKAQGYETEIPEGSTLNSVTIVNGVAKVDFNETAESGGGSCSMAMRTAQIRQTLFQFSSVKSVEFSVNGRTGDIFQP